MTWDDFERMLCWMIVSAVRAPMPSSLQPAWCGTWNRMHDRGWVK